MKLFKLSLILVLALVFAACAAPPAPAAEAPAAAPAVEAPAAEVPAEAPAEAEAVTLRYFMWDPSFEEEEQQMVDKFMAANPNVTVEFETIGTPDYWTKLSALSAAMTCPASST